MKKVLTKILCAVLACVTVLSCTSIAFADNGVTPVITVHGMGAISIYKNPESSSKSELGTFDFGSLFTSNNDVFHDLLDATQGKMTDPSKLIDQIKRLLESFNEIACDTNGNPAADTGIADYWTDSLANHTDYLTSADSNEPALWRSICDKVGADNVYAFNYDWRVDIAENGEKLDKFIDIVKQKTGKSKVTVVGGSEGAAVVAAYVDAHKNDNELEKVVYLDGAFNGAGITKVFKQDIYFDKDVLLNYLAELTKTYNNKSFDMNRLTWLSTTMTATAENVCNILNKIVNDPTLLAKFYNEVLYPAFGNIPALWEFIEYEDFDAAVEKMSAIGFLDKSSGLYTKITNYHAIQGRFASNVADIKAKGVQVAIIANYGTPSIPVTSAYKNQSDILIDTKLASAGATVADYKTTLPASRTEKNSYASPDEIIDASTCILPDSTWFIKGVQHMDFWYGADACNFVAALVTTSAPTTIGSIKAETGIGQFAGTDSSQNIVEIESTKPKKTKVTKIKKGKKSFKVTVKKISAVKGYQIQYSTSSRFTAKKTKTVTLSSKKTSKTIKKLKKNKKYYVRVRTYRVVANQKVYSDWSSVKTVKTK